MKEKQKLDFLRKVTTEQVERARIVVRMKSLSDKRKEEQEKFEAEERDREYKERKGLFAHDTRFEDNMERVRQKIRSTSYDAKEAASLSRRNSFAELHRLPSISDTAPSAAEAVAKAVQRSQSAGKHRKGTSNNVPKQPSAKLSKRESSKLTSKNVKIGPSKRNILENKEASDQISNASDTSSPTRNPSSRRPFASVDAPVVPSKSSTSTKASKKVKAAAVVVSLLSAAGALDYEVDDNTPGEEEKTAQEAAAKEREVALQKRLALRRQAELEEKQRKTEEIKQKKEQQERVR